ncbi:hypothetical protein [Trujillonella endophytica]|uniref:Membrane protein involved in the export of O-antigen and teichoic acid n=1 Tax=Trujillonella endophytica TaxID=673521 RepID=A0A1H8W534_9ACTN|nr:hypothetical protein [Trujillella endophytica]SEP22754.1 hypothetical protein SAMN05660991_04078 [Trujillella endophytica]
MESPTVSTVPEEPAPVATVEPRRAGGVRTAWLLARRILGFAAMPAMGLVSAVAVLPAISHNFGADGWIGIAFGQSVGAALAAVASLHWPLAGANEIAAHPAHRAALVRQSVRQRLVALACLLPLAVGIPLWLSPGDTLSSTLAAVALSGSCMAQTWLYTGLGDPGRLALFEGAPRLAANIAAIGLLVLTPYLWIYPLLQGLATLTSLLLSLRFVRRLPDQVPTLPRDPSAGELALATTAQVSNAAYAYLVGPLISVVTPAFYPIFAAGDRISKILLQGMAAVPAAFLSWVGGAAPDQRRARARQASIVMGVLSLFATVLLGATMPLISRYLFAGTVDLEEVAWLIGATMGAAFLNASLFLVGLVPQGHLQTTYRLLLVASVFCPTLTIVGGLLGGVHGLYVGALVAFLVLIAVQLRIIFRSRELGAASDD